MDWERTKSLLIIAFILLNIIFSAQLWLIPAYLSTPRSISSQQVELRLLELRYRHIKVSAAVPRSLKPQRMMDFKAEILSAPDVADKVLGLGWSPLEAEDGRWFVKGDAKVGIYPDNRISYINSLQLGEGSQNLTQAREAAEAFVSQTLGIPGDARLVVSQEQKGVWYFEYRQYWRRQQLAVSYIRVWISGGHVARMDWYWAEPLGRVPTDISIIPATGALLIAADYLTPPAEITGIYLSWYSEPLQAERWRVPSVWVVETAFSRYYVNAFTGELEAREDIPAGESTFVVE